MKIFFRKVVPFIYFIAATFGLVSSTKSQPAFLTNSLVAYFPFNGSPNDTTTNLHNGVLNGVGITYAADRFGSNNAAVHFAGGGYISITPTPFNASTNYTVSFWTKLDSASYPVDNFLSTAGDNQGGYDVRVVPNTVVGWAVIGMGPRGIDSLPPTNYTVWHSIVNVHQDTNDLLYIDGVLMAQGGHIGTTLDSGSLWLGRHQNPSFTYDLQGDMDDLRIYNRAFSSDEVSQLFQFESGESSTSFLTNGLVAFYPFNGSLNDTTGNLHSGVLNGSGTSYVPDRFGSNNAAIHFDGGGDVSIAPTPFNPNADYSVSFWTQLDSNGSQIDNFLSTGGDNQGGYNVRLVSGGVLGWIVEPMGPQGILAVLPTNYNVWHSLVSVQLGTNDFFYIDGVLVGTTTHPGTTLDTGSLLVGQHQNGSFPYGVQGSMDDLRVYNRALSSNEITQLYAYESPPPVVVTNGLVAYYPFNSSVNDVTGNRHSGILSGSGITYTADRFGTSNAAIHFSGDGHVGITPTPFNPNADYTVSFWTQLDSNGSQIDNFLSTGGDNQGGYEVRLIALGWVAEPMGPQGILSVPPTDYTVWHSLVSVQQGTNDFFYIDGVLMGQTTHPGTTLDTGTLWVGQHQNASFLYGVQGAMDDLRIYNRALSGDEIGQLFLSEAATLERSAMAASTISNGFVIAASIQDGGLGYTNAPKVQFIGGGGAGAQGTAVISNGTIVSISIGAAGSNYTTAPLVVITPPVIPNPNLAVAPMSLLTFSNLAVGGNYQLQVFGSNFWVSQPGSITASGPVYTQFFSGSIDPSKYRLAPSPAPVQAFATPQIVNGFVIGASINDGGIGYVTPPQVSIVGGSGTNAAAIAQVGGGVVTNIMITSAGIGYAPAPPAIQIAPPPAGSGISPTLQPALRIDAANLSVYQNYQLQVSQDLTTGWSNFSGGLFSPTNATNSEFVIVTNNTGFFRLQYLP